ncbi:hypothetical protein ACWDRB_41520 [Nonomuraea sp. NPDC003707]
MELDEGRSFASQTRSARGTSPGYRSSIVPSMSAPARPLEAPIPE